MGSKREKTQFCDLNWKNNQEILKFLSDDLLSGIFRIFDLGDFFYF